MPGRGQIACPLIDNPAFQSSGRESDALLRPRTDSSFHLPGQPPDLSSKTAELSNEARDPFASLAMKFLKARVNKLRRALSPAGRVDCPPSGVQPAGLPPERIGLIPLFPPEGDEMGPTGPESYPVDIIAIHGLNGDAFSTWTATPGGKLWLRDFLPGCLPGCRVYTYGYPSEIFSNSVAQVREYAEHLVVQIRDVQEQSALGLRPVIFVCHSLGGIVFKEALVLAHELNEFYGRVLESVAGVVFLGTPHRGSDVASLGSVLGTVINTLTAAATVGLRPRVARTDLLDHLNPKSKALADLVMASRTRMTKLKIVSFYETNPMPPLATVVVEKTSATLGFPNEQSFALWEDHRSLCRFHAKTNSYRLIVGRLREMAHDAAKTSQALQRASTPSSCRSLTDTERTCVTLLNSTSAAENDDDTSRSWLLNPAPGTCQWIRRDRDFISWLERPGSSLLWLTGHPGCGKTTLSFSLARYVQELQAGVNASHVLVYFCDNKHSKQTDGRAVLTGLIFQVINRDMSMCRRHVLPVFKRQGQSMIRSFSSLWSLFIAILSDERAGCFYVILDALDECEGNSCRQLVKSIADVLADDIDSVGGRAAVKFLITSRPHLHESLSGANTAFQSNIFIEGQIGYIEDLHRYIEQRVEELSLNRQCSTEAKEYLLQAMLDKADQTFLWTHMVLQCVEGSLLTSLRDFRTIIDTVPEKLAETYTRYLSSVPTGYHAQAAALLRLLLASKRPLSVDELNIAFTVNASHVTTEQVARESQTAMAHTVQGILGPLARVSPYQVSLVHQSLKQFLLESLGDPGSFASRHSVNTQGAALCTASACVAYLSLKDFRCDLVAKEREAPLFTSRYSDDTLQDLSANYFGNLWDEEMQGLDTDILFESTGFDHETCRSLSSRYRFYSYSSMHWADHLASCDEHLPDELRASARRLLDTESTENWNCRNWLRYYETQCPVALDVNLVEQHPVVLAAYFNLHTILCDFVDTYELSVGIRNRSLYWASRLGHDRIVATMLTLVADPNSRELEGQTALTTACEHGHLPCVCILLADPRVAVNGLGRRGRNALSFACGNGHEDIAMVLLDRDECDADGPDDSGTTPFLWAAWGGNLPILQALLQRRSVDINHRDKEGRTAFSWAAGDGMNRVLEALIALPGIDANIGDTKGKSPLLWAAGNGHSTTVRFLLDCNMVDKGATDRDKRNAMSWASGGGHYRTLSTLLDAGRVEADSQDVDGWTPLAWSVHTDSPRCVDAIISKGRAEIEHRDHSGRTALSWAVEYGHISVVKVLLQAGANPAASSNGGRTPISIARQLERADLLDELMKSVR